MSTTHFHICAFFDSRDEAHQALVPFYREAMARNERNLHLVEPHGQDAHRARLAQAGIDVPGCELRGQLAVRPWPADWAEPGGLDVEGLLEAMNRATAPMPAPGPAGGFDGVRVMAQMGWAARPGQDGLDLLAYEARLNALLAERRQLAICVYDLAALDGTLMMDLLRTHPLTMIGGVLRENPFFTPPAEMLRELSARRAMGRRRGRPAPEALPVPAWRRQAE